MIVLLYLVWQMLGAGKLAELLLGFNYTVAVMIVGVRWSFVYVFFGRMLATTWIQIIKAALLLAGAAFMAFMVFERFGFSLNALFSQAILAHPKHLAIMSPAWSPIPCLRFRSDSR